MTGRATVPNVIVAGKSIGGGDELVEMHRKGTSTPVPARLPHLVLRYIDAFALADGISFSCCSGKLKALLAAEGCSFR